MTTGGFPKKTVFSESQKIRDGITYVDEALYENKLSMVFDDLSAARETQDRIIEFVRNHPTVYCGYVYDPAEHDGVAFEDLPDYWVCPKCKQALHDFVQYVPAVSLLHGLYDFSLTEEVETITDASAFIAVTLAVLDQVIIIALIIFICKNKNNPKYTEPLGQKSDI